MQKEEIFPPFEKINKKEKRCVFKSLNAIVLFEQEQQSSIKKGCLLQLNGIYWFYIETIGENMSSAVKLSENIVNQAKIVSRALNRSVAGQIEYWAKIGRLAEENPDLTYELIKQILLSQEEAKAGKLEPYVFNEDKNRDLKK